MITARGNVSDMGAARMRRTIRRRAERGRAHGLRARKALADWADRRQAQADGETPASSPPGASSCRVYWGTHGCRHPSGHDPSLPHECDCCQCVNHPDPDPENPGNAPSCVAAPPYYGPETRFYGEDAEALGMPLPPRNGCRP